MWATAGRPARARRSRRRAWRCARRSCPTIRPVTGSTTGRTVRGGPGSRRRGGRLALRHPPRRARRRTRRSAPTRAIANSRSGPATRPCSSSRAIRRRDLLAEPGATSRRSRTTGRSRNIEAVARAWFRERATESAGPARGVVRCAVGDELAEQVAFALGIVCGTDPDRPFPATAKPALRDRVFFSPKPLGPKAKVAFVFPGSGNQFDGMGRDLSAQWPEVLRRQQAENELLRSQFAPDLFWDGAAEDASPRDLMFGQVAVGSLVSDIVVSLGVRARRDDRPEPRRVGRAVRRAGVARPRRDVPPDAALDAVQLGPRSALRRRPDALEPVRGASRSTGSAAIIAAPPDDVRAALQPGLRAYLLIVNTPTECVIGGERADVAKLAAAIGKPVTCSAGVTLAHCEAGRPVEEPYRELHTLPATPPPGVDDLQRGVGQELHADRPQLRRLDHGRAAATPIDVPAVIEAAYRDGVRVFIEVGPGALVRAGDRRDPRRPTAPAPARPTPRSRTRCRRCCGWSRTSRPSACRSISRRCTAARPTASATASRSTATPNEMVDPGRPEAGSRDGYPVAPPSGRAGIADAGGDRFRLSAALCTRVTAGDRRHRERPGRSRCSRRRRSCGISEQFTRICRELVSVPDAIARRDGSDRGHSDASTDESGPSSSELDGSPHGCRPARSHLRAVLRVRRRAQSATCSGRCSPRSTPSRRASGCPTARCSSSIASRSSRASRSR